MTKYNKRIGDSFGCDWPEILWKNRAKGPLKGFLGGCWLSSIFLVPTKNIFKNYNTWLWSGLAFFRSRLSAPAFVELRSKEDNPLNKLVKQKNKTVNYRNKCDFLYFANILISFLMSSIHSAKCYHPASQRKFNLG